ncbi:cyclase family protein [uncultured Sphaerochaeta sp.]|uniref:cyclase family protein n=1 Tax=uncultured Sphaerochaeta sp. TaxID=886478 RepID=UPI002A0A2EF8|nr:cyclase family protein [uncultured Sphaerochaeta sp.]
MYIDLSLPIQPHWRYAFQHNLVSSFEKGDQWQISEFKMKSHWFSHIDFPRHTGLAFPDSESFPLDHYNGMASVLMITSPTMVNHAITAEELEKAKKGRSLEKILLIRSDWGVMTSWETHEFWSMAPYLTDEAIEWIAAQNPKTVAFDFPQDYSIRLLQDRKVSPEEQKTHIILLRQNILLVEYLANFNAIKQETCEFICLPLRIPHIDGCPVRAVAKI